MQQMLYWVLNLTGWPHFGCAAHTLKLSINTGLNHFTIKKAIAAAVYVVLHDPVVSKD